jgi:alanyl-tRNA synthetase
VNFMGQVIAGIEPKALRGLADEQMKVIGSGVVAIIASNENANTVVVAVSQDLTGTYAAPALVQAATAAMGGQGGGGRPEMAQGGGPAGDAEAKAAVEAIKSVLAG